MSPADRLRQILTTYPAGAYMIDTLEISHSLFSQRYLFTREPAGITATTELDETVLFKGANFEPVLNTTKNDLDTIFAFTMPDPDNELDDELDRLPLNNTEPIMVYYRPYNSEDLTAPAAVYRLQVLNVSQEKGRFTFEAGAAQLNWRKTGEIYSFTRFPMLRAL